MLLLVLIWGGIKMNRKPYGFIYITTNMINGKKYIGQKKFNGGWKGYLGSGKHFKSALMKYGKENFARDIVDIAYSGEELNQKEIQWINNHNAIESDDFYNIAKGGKKNNMAGLSSEALAEWKRKLSESHIGICAGERHPMYGKTHSVEARAKISQSQIGRPSPKRNVPISEEQKQKISKANKGKIAHNKGKAMSDEHRRKLSEAKRGISPPIETVLKTSKGVKQLNMDGSVVNQFYSISEAARQTNTDRRHISECCKGIRESCGGCKWAFS